jgi:hypothetical protein
MDYYWELINIVEKTVDYAFEGKFRLNMYEYLKSEKFNKNDIEKFMNSDTVKSIQQLREAYGHHGKPEARKIKNYLKELLQDCWKYGKEKRTRKRRKPSK